jgi:glycosyltransferase involved in cell wall biosynthesis
MSDMRAPKSTGLPGARQGAADLPLVSAVIPVFNGAPYVREAIDSALGQTYPAIEVVVVNDGSTDETSAILSGYGDRITVVEQQNRGISLARNEGIKRARGEFIAMLDHDDWWLPEKIERQVALFLADEGIDLVHSGVEFYDDARGAFGEPLNDESKRSRLTGHCYEALLQENTIVNSSVAVRASALQFAGCYNPMMERACEDYELWLRLARNGRFGYVPERLTVFRVHPKQRLQSWTSILSEEARLLESTISAEGLSQCPTIRPRMSRLYDSLGTHHLDGGNRLLARESFARSLGWKWNARAAMLWTVSLLPNLVIRLLRHLHLSRKSKATSG